MDCSRRPRFRSDPRRVLVLAAALAAGSVPGAAADEYAVAVSGSIRVESVTFAQLQQMFRFQKRFWEAGRPIDVVLPATGSESREFLVRRVMRSTDGALHRVLVEKMYRGEMDTAPAEAPSDREALRLLAGSRGAITLVRVGAALEPGTRWLAVDGQKPGDPNYPLRD